MAAAQLEQPVQPQSEEPMEDHWDRWFNSKEYRRWGKICRARYTYPGDGFLTEEKALELADEQDFRREFGYPIPG